MRGGQNGTPHYGTNMDRPSNACNLTLQYMYLIKSIVTSPREDSFTRFVLQDLNFQPSSQHFGIFFLTTLHRHTLAVHQMEQDDDAIIQHVTKELKSTKPPQKIQRSHGSSANENQEIQPEHEEENGEEVNEDDMQEQDHSEEESDHFNIESEDSEDSEDL
ncbi:hypothetical protein M422DRAFT_266752 [Sphaerobolus stellatus SS14]|uniref:Uncharacterized protein n=1 Tax=Sphaerobolus stellatus (strain SS14) TaxID=990650 RepID=A0A0C9V1Q6_SPHS4|nr:hypothetical protein M422DRAFT_266752 [Sphaerobolus stellatus SS14]